MYCELSAIKILSFLNFILCLKLNSQVEAGLLGRISNLETLMLNENKIYK